MLWQHLSCLLSSKTWIWECWESKGPSSCSDSTGGLSFFTNQFIYSISEKWANHFWQSDRSHSLLLYLEKNTLKNHENEPLGWWGWALRNSMTKVVILVPDYSASVLRSGGDGVPWFQPCLSLQSLLSYLVFMPWHGVCHVAERVEIAKWNVS